MKIAGINAVFAIGAFLSLMAAAFAGTVTLRPDSDGYYTAWTSGGCAGGDYACVDEASASTSDYVYGASNSVKESFGFSNSGLSTGTINSVTLYYYAQRYSSSKYNMQPMIRSGTSDYLASTKTLGSSYALTSQAYSTNPATGSAWTIAEVDALQAGMATSSSKGGAYVAQMYAIVNYTIPNSCSDTDGGDVKGVYGTVSGYASEASYSYNDYCVDTSNVYEYYCSGTSSAGQQESCGTDGYIGSNYCTGGDVYRTFADYFCSGGACGSSNTSILQEDCGESGFVGSKYCMNATYVYQDYRYVYCSSGACGSTTSPSFIEACNNTCVDGACV